MSVLERIQKGQPVNVVPFAALAGMSPVTVYRAIDRGEIDAIKIGSRVTIPAHVARKLLRLPDEPVAA